MNKTDIRSCIQPHDCMASLPTQPQSEHSPMWMPKNLPTIV